MLKLYCMSMFRSQCKNMLPLMLRSTISIPYELRFITTCITLNAEELSKLSPLVLSLTDWKPIYRFQHIIAARAIQRLKVYQTGLTCFVFLPSCIAATHFGYASSNLLFTGLGASALACLTLLILGTMSSRVIGILYVNKDSNQIRVARLSFFGSRVDKVVSADFFVPITDTSADPADTYIVLETVVKDEATFFGETLPPFLQEKYYISIKYGTILDPETFNSILGDVSQFLGKTNRK